jgi:integrase/recombinase XerD
LPHDRRTLLYTGWRMFGVNATVKGARLKKVQKWRGHADLKTTSIHAGASGAEEDKIAERMWGAHG